jgi:hypothetical protein
MTNIRIEKLTEEWKDSCGAARRSTEAKEPRRSTETEELRSSVEEHR